MLTFCGFEEGQTEANLSEKGLGPIDAKLIARELTTGYVSSSLKSLNLSTNQLWGVRMGEYYRGRLEQNGTYDATGIKAIADALSVSTSLKFLK